MCRDVERDHGGVCGGCRDVERVERDKESVEASTAIEHSETRKERVEAEARRGMQARAGQPRPLEGREVEDREVEGREGSAA